jgi:hypothetical protein
MAIKVILSSVFRCHMMDLANRMSRFLFAYKTGHKTSSFILRGNLGVDLFKMRPFPVDTFQ